MSTPQVNQIAPGTTEAEIECPNPSCKKMIQVSIPAANITNHRDFTTVVSTHEELEQCPVCHSDLLPQLVAVNTIWRWIPGKDAKPPKKRVVLAKPGLVI